MMLKYSMILICHHVFIQNTVLIDSNKELIQVFLFGILKDLRDSLWIFGMLNRSYKQFKAVGCPKCAGHAKTFFLH